MNRETIEKAANAYSDKQFWIEDDYYARECMDIIAPSAFIAGAQWRINSVWHDAETDIPRENEPIIGMAGGMCCYMGLCGQTAKEICPEMAKWAYVSDLLPDRKEEHP